MMSSVVRLLSVAVSTTIGLSSLPVLAGGMESGGGKGVLCGSHLRTLEVYEAEEVYHLPPSIKYPALDENLVNYGSPLGVYWSSRQANANDGTFQRFVLRLAQSLMNRMVDIPAGTTLPVTDDATLPWIPSDCSVVQIAIYLDQNDIIQRDKALWNMLSPFDQAALIWHEWYYATARGHGLTTSDDTRRLIGLAMFNQLPEPLFMPFWNLHRYLSCTVFDKENKVGLSIDGKDEVRNGISGVALYSGILARKMVSFRSTAFLPGVKLSDFSTPEKKSWLTKIQNDFTSKSWNLELTIKRSNDPQSRVATAQVWSEGETPSQLYDGSCGFIEISASHETR